MPSTEVEDDRKNSILHISSPTLITTTTTTIANHDDSLPPSGMKKKVISYSQPLGQTGGRRKQGGRNHSLDEEDYVTSAAILAVDGINSRSYQHSASLPEEALRRHRHLPPPPNHHIHLSGGPYHHLSLERIMSSSVPAIPEEESGSHEDMLVEGANLAALPEFIGGGGGQGIFKVPTRGAVDPGRPPVLELRPHPLRETQMGSFLRTIACAQSQVWAGQESGVRVWDLQEAFRDWDDGVNILRGDEESAPFQESYRTSPTMCLVVDAANRLVWSGHKDGKIRSWKMDRTQNHVSSGECSDSVSSCPTASCGSFSAAVAATGSNSGFKEGLSWQAHRGPVLCMTFTAQGDLWSASEGGIVKVWPWESIEKSLSLSMEERHLAALLVERSCVDLRSQVTVGGACSLPSADIRFLLSDDSRSKVWTGASVSFALWNSLTKELIKVFNMDGQVENRIDMPAGHDTCEDEIKVKYASTSKKEKSQLSFFQRSRNALIGAADAVRKVATKGAFGEDNRKTEVMTISMDGMIWTGCANGALVQWDENANRLQEFQHHSSSVLSLCAFGTRLWVGYASGNIQILDLEGNLLGGWVAHSSPVIRMAVGGGYLFTLANHGGIRGWHLTSPGSFDKIMRSELTNSELLYTKFENFKILAGTWNVGQERASHDSLVSWVGSAASEADMVIIGCQEVEMGAGFLAMAAAKETVGLEGSANGHWWSDAIGNVLDEGKVFERVGTRQLAGLLISVWARKNLRKHIGDIDAGAVACGFGRAIGNKGGVGLRMRIYGRTVCLVNCHFAAHLEAVHKRNADFDHIFRTMSFSRPSIGPYSSGALASSTIQGARGPNASGLPSDDGTPELSEADLLIFLGDFNYRLHGISYDEARDFISQRSFDWLREKDQLREEMKAGKVFQGMREGLIRFPPTYKFDRHKVGLSGYDSGEKKRIPAWCDRILYRDNRSVSLQECSLECPVVTSILKYEACMDVTDSDHKPVRCLLNVDIARSDKMVKRNEFGKILLSNNGIKCLLEQIGTVPEIIVTPSTIVLQNQEAANILITNKCEKGTAIIRISCKEQSPVRENWSASEPYPRGGAGFPRWLEVTPTIGLIQPDRSLEISIKHEEFLSPEFVIGTPQNSTCNDTRDKEVTLLVDVVGNFTTNSISHSILVRHCFSPKTVSRNS